MRINWIISKDKTKALLNNGDLEVLIKKVDLEKDSLEKSKINDYMTLTLAFKKIETNNYYNIIIISNNIKSYLEKLNSQDLARFTSKLCSKLGDVYEEQ